MSNPTSKDQLIDAVTDLTGHWGEEACDFLDELDHDQFATELVIGGCIQLARALMDDGNAEQRAYFVRLLASDGTQIDEQVTQ
jgi:hypothetical protein